MNLKVYYPKDGRESVVPTDVGEVLRRSHEAHVAHDEWERRRRARLTEASAPHQAEVEAKRERDRRDLRWTPEEQAEVERRVLALMQERDEEEEV